MDKATIEASIRKNLSGSTITSLVIEKRTVKWIVDNHEMAVATAPESEIWVAVADGDIDPTIVPGQATAYGWFKRLVILLDPESGEALGFKGTPKSSNTTGA
jgi:hypothetical protein